jgi:hypothetical protein
MIIHASLKTDISYFYTTWLCNRLKEGFFDIQSNIPGEILRYRFKDNPIEKIYLHTKNPYKIIKNFSDLKSFKQYYEIVTHISMYDKFYEQKISDKYKIFEYVRECKKLVGKENNSICYGPIFKTIINDLYWHINQFKFLCNILHNSISTIYYDFSISNLCKESIYFNATEFSKQEQKEIINQFKLIAQQYNILLKEIPNERKFKHNEIDIGEINTCPATCKYCKYITNSKTAIIKNSMHNSNSSLLIGTINTNDKIKNVILTEKEEETPIIEPKCNQYSLFDFV